MVMNKPIISIIVPIYNVENYLTQCLQSIVTQLTDPNRVEVILVNDCSSDGSKEIAEKYAKMHDHVNVIHHEVNQGLSIARNTGINAAKGDWIWFIDSDDWIEQDSLKTLFRLIEEERHCDVICIQKKDVFKGGCRINNVIAHPMCMSGKQYLRSILQKTVAAKFIVKRQFLLDHHLFFYPHILHEDVLYGYTMLYCAPKIYVSDKPLYVKRCERSGSIMHTIGEKNAYDCITIHQQLMIFMNEMVSQEDKGWFFRLSFGIICKAYCYIGRTSGIAMFQNKNKEYIKSVCKEALRYKGGFFKVKSLIVRYMPRYLSPIEESYYLFRKKKAV